MHLFMHDIQLVFFKYSFRTLYKVENDANGILIKVTFRVFYLMHHFIVISLSTIFLSFNAAAFLLHCRVKNCTLIFFSRGRPKRHCYVREVQI